MKLTRRLLGYLYRAFDTDPDAYTAFRLSSVDGLLRWTVADRVMTTTVDGLNAHTISLVGHTVGSLAATLAAVPGYRVNDLVGDERVRLAAVSLIDGTGSPSELNGDRLRAYQSLTWAYLDACAVELQALSDAAAQAPRQMATATAEGDWLDELGGYYNVGRLVGEGDTAYGARIVAEVIAPKNNNVALEIAIRRAFGQSVSVTDVRLWGDAFPLLNGTISLNGAHTLNASATPLYGLFDVAVGYDLESGPSIEEFQVQVRAFIDRVRAAGTHLRALALTGSSLADIVDESTDGGAIPFSGAVLLDDAAVEPTEAMSSMDSTMATLEDAVDIASDGIGLNFSYTTLLNGVRRLNGAVPMASGVVIMESF